MLSIRILGPLEVERSGQSVPIPGIKTRLLLIRLALEVGSVVSNERLFEAMWGDDPPANTANALQARASELRRALGPTVVIARARGYVLAVEPDSVDWHRAGALVTDARRLAPSNPELAVEHYTAALRLWRGRDSAGLVDLRSGFPIASPLDELRLAAFEERAHLELAAGRGRLLVGDVTAMTADHPLRESLIELLILSLAASGRQSDALAVYRDLRNRLVEQLGVEPSPRLQQVEAQVLAHDPATFRIEDRPTTSDEHRAFAERATVSVPNPLSSFIDRPLELATLLGMLDRRRLVTITGPGGVGKTRLAIEAAHRIELPPDGTWFVTLEATHDLDQVHDAIVAVLGAPGADARTALSQRLRTARLLLVLDNCEHLSAPFGVLVSQLLEEAPGLRVLATSQRPIGIAGEALLLLGPLPREAAARLFVDRARDSAPDLFAGDHTDTQPFIDRICARIEDLPLAIELAAGRCDVLSLNEIADHLDQGLGVLRDVRSGRAARHRTLDSTISWSYNLLFPDAQVLLQALASFAGGAPFGGLQTVATSLGLPAGEVLDLLSHLVERSVVAIERDPAGSRYHLLDSIRSFASSRSIEDERHGAIAAAHAGWVVQMAGAAATGMRSDAQLAHLDSVRRERSNIDAGLAWLLSNDPVQALDVASALYYAWLLLGDGPAGALRIEHALIAAGPSAEAEQRALACARTAQLLARSGSIDRALEFVSAAEVDITDFPERSQLEVQALRGRVLIHAGRYDEGVALELDVWRRFEVVGDVWGAAMARLTIGWAHALRGEPDQAASETRSALAALASTPDTRITHVGHRLLGVLDAGAGRWDSALEHYSIALDAARALGSAIDEGQTLARIATALSHRGDRSAAMTALGDALVVSRLAGDYVTARAVALQIEALHDRRTTAGSAP